MSSSSTALRRSPFPAGEGLRVSADFFDIQRTSDIAIILFRQIGIFLSNYFALVMEFSANFFNIIFLFAMQNYISESYSLNI